MAGIVYRPEIDGLRAFAVIPVILFHLGVSWIPGGYIGVDAFFVISGFLITSIILREYANGSFSFQRFWARRIRRILPAMVFVSAVTLAVTHTFVFRPDQQAIGKQGLAALLSVANIYFWYNTGDYWGGASEDSPFLHTWSLSVEEQFYMFFPIAIWLILRLGSSWLKASMTIAVLASLTIFLWGVNVHPIATFYLLPTRVWELGSGCLLALSTDGKSKTSDYGAFANVGLGMLILSYFFTDTLSSGVAIAVFGASLVITFGQSGLTNKLLTQHFVVHIGKISYSLYLWHWPILVLAKHLEFEWPGPADKAILVALTYVLSLVTFYAVEQTTRRREGVVPVTLLCALIVAIASATMAFIPRHYDTSSFSTPSWAHYKYELDPRGSPTDVEHSVGLGVNMPCGDQSSDAYKNGGIIVEGETATPKIVVLGDSHGLMWSDLIRTIIEDHGITTSFYSMGGTSPFIEIPPSRHQKSRKLSEEEKYDYDIKRLHYLRQWRPELVIIACRWKATDESDSEDLIRFLLGINAKILLLESPPELKIGNSQNAMQIACYHRIYPRSGVREFFPKGDNSRHSTPRRIAKLHPGVRSVGVGDLYLKDEQVLILDGHEIVYIDNDHLSMFGANIARHRIEESMLSMLAEAR